MELHTASTYEGRNINCTHYNGQLYTISICNLTQETVANVYTMHTSSDQCTCMREFGYLMHATHGYAWIPIWAE